MLALNNKAQVLIVTITEPNIIKFLKNKNFYVLECDAM